MAEPDSVAVNLLPRELLELILRHLTSNSGAKDVVSLISSLCVCKLWHKAGLPVLWTEVVLSSTPFAQFTSALNASSEQLVRFLTPTLPPVCCGNKERAWLEHDEVIIEKV